MDLRDFSRALRRKAGAYEDRTASHIIYRVSIGEANRAVAMFSYSMRGGRLPEFVVANAAKRLRLTKAELEDRVECPLSADAFLELWQARSP